MSKISVDTGRTKYGHVEPRPLSKVLPRTLPCHGCKDGRPSVWAYIEAALADATPEDLINVIEQRRAARRAA